MGKLDGDHLDPTAIEMDVDPTAIEMDVDPTTRRLSGVAVHGNTPFDVPYISQIEGNLWQGGCRNQLILPEHIKHVVSLYPWESYNFWHTYDSKIEVFLYDGLIVPNEDQLLALAAWINVCRATAPTLVHCQAGLNRSALLCALALITGPEHLDPAAAIALLREKRSPAVLCNPAFEGWLMERFA